MLAARPARAARRDHRGGESEFIGRLLGPHAFPEDLQPLGNCGHDVLVVPNGAELELAREQPPPRAAAGAAAAAHGSARRAGFTWPWTARTRAAPRVRLRCGVDGWLASPGAS